MFGPKMRIEFDGFGVTLRPPKKTEMEALAPVFSSMLVHMYTMRTYAVTPEDETDWYEKIRKDNGSCQWGIVPDGEDSVVGFTGLHGIDPIGMSCTSGIIIARTDLHGKGIATRTHLARTMFAADYLNRYTIQSQVRVPNEASVRALERVGYMRTGKHLSNWYRDGRFMDTYVLSWLHPDRLMFTKPNGLNDEETHAVERAQNALQKARAAVKFL